MLYKIVTDFCMSCVLKTFNKDDDNDDDDDDDDDKIACASVHRLRTPNLRVQLCHMVAVPEKKKSHKSRKSKGDSRKGYVGSVISDMLND